MEQERESKTIVSGDLGRWEMTSEIGSFVAVSITTAVGDAGQTRQPPQVQLTGEGGHGVPVGAVPDPMGPSATHHKRDVVDEPLRPFSLPLHPPSSWQSVPCGYLSLRGCVKSRWLVGREKNAGASDVLVGGRGGTAGWRSRAQ